MKKMAFLFIKYRIYFLSLFILLLSAASVEIIYGSDILAIPIHAAHPAWLNIFFINYTFMGDAFFALAMSGFFFFYLKQQQTGVQLFTVFVITELTVQLLKNVFSSRGVQLFLEEGQYLFFREEGSLFQSSCVLSGHTALAFAMATVFILRMSNKAFQIILLISCILMAVSRMYLAQETLSSVAAGALTGALSAAAVLYLLQQAAAMPTFFKKWPVFASRRKGGRMQHA